MISVEKITINLGVGGAGEKLEKAKKLIIKMTDQKPIETKGKRRIPTWDIKKGTIVGTKVTLRKKKALDFLSKCLDSIDRQIPKKAFDTSGNFSFGVREYIDIPGFKYDPDIGMYGFDVCVTLQKWGYRVGNRKRKEGKVPKRHRITKDESMEFAKKKLKIEIVE